MSCPCLRRSNPPAAVANDLHFKGLASATVTTWSLCMILAVWLKGSHAASVCLHTVHPRQAEQAANRAVDMNHAAGRVLIDDIGVPSVSTCAARVSATEA
jgi:hypothetical protein